jgi:glutamine amidotransferase
MYDRIGIETNIADNPLNIKKSSLVVLPGVGSFDAGVGRLSAKGWGSWIKEAAESKLKIVGLCLGMQLLCEGSDEGNLDGIGLLPGRFGRFPNQDEAGNVLKVPHMGWNTVDFDFQKSPWARALDVNSKFYFNLNS